MGRCQMTGWPFTFAATRPMYVPRDVLVEVRYPGARMPPDVKAVAASGTRNVLPMSMRRPELCWVRHTMHDPVTALKLPDAMPGSGAGTVAMVR